MWRLGAGLTLWSRLEKYKERDAFCIQSKQSERWKLFKYDKSLGLIKHLSTWGNFYGEVKLLEYLFIFFLQSSNSKEDTEWIDWKIFWFEFNKKSVLIRDDGSQGRKVCWERKWELSRKACVAPPQTNLHPNWNTNCSFSLKQQNAVAFYDFLFV